MEDDCTFSTNLHNSLLLQTVRWIQIFVSFSSILIVLFASRNLNRTIFDSIAIVLIKFHFLIIVLYSIGYGATQVTHVFARYIAVTPCDAQFPKMLCLFRSISAIIGPFFVLTHSSIIIQQALSAFKFPLRLRKRVAGFTVFLTFCYVIAYGILSLTNESFSGLTQVCSSSKSIEIITIANLNIIMIMNAANTVSAIFLLRHNKQIMSKERNSFELSRKFKRVQNLYAMKQFIPLIALQSMAHFTHFCLYSFTFYYRPNYTRSQFTILYSVVNVAPFYCLFSPLTFLILTKLGRFRRKENVKIMTAPMQKSKEQEIYFKNLTAAWDAPN